MEGERAHCATNTSVAAACPLPLPLRLPFLGVPAGARWARCSGRASQAGAGARSPARLPPPAPVPVTATGRALHLGLLLCLPVPSQAGPSVASLPKTDWEEASHPSESH